MDQKTVVMDILLKAWSQDRGERDFRSDNYRKDAWMYVQARLEEYFQNQVNKSAN
jgi:hypothetical protein